MSRCTPEFWAEWHAAYAVAVKATHCVPECAVIARRDGSCNIAHERITQERRLIRRFIREAKKDGWLPFVVQDGGDEPILVTSETEVMDAVFAVDVSVIHFRHTSRNVRSFVSVMLGNGKECLSDCGELMSATYDRVHGLD